MAKDRLIEELCEKYLGKGWDKKFKRENKICEDLDSLEKFDYLYPEEDEDDNQ